MRRASHLSTYDFAALSDACESVDAAFGQGCGTFLVGSVLDTPDFRDVDVRVILPDEEFDALFGGREVFWQVVSRSITAWLRDVTKLPVDFQVQRMTEANEKHSGRRHAIGMDVFKYAGGGDATAFGSVPGQTDA